jgi:hypothetical protein
MVFMILNNSLMVDSWVFNAYHVHYSELLQRQTPGVVPFTFAVEIV